MRRLQKELEEIKTDPPSNCSAGLKDDNIYEWEATIIGPGDSPYSGGIFRLSMLFSNDFPFKPPRVKFITKILHPNIDEYGNICLDILNQNWSPVLNVSKLLLSISSLLTDPNADDPLNPEIADVYKTDNPKFIKMARNYTLKHAI
jgi:ubiquitin-conjugating enzyme E2 D/E